MTYLEKFIYVHNIKNYSNEISYSDMINIKYVDVKYHWIYLKKYNGGLFISIESLNCTAILEWCYSVKKFVDIIKKYGFRECNHYHLETINYFNVTKENKLIEYLLSICIIDRKYMIEKYSLR